jgi:hypothetical protein
MIDPTDSGLPVPMVNVVAICQLSDDSPLPTESLHDVMNESPNDYSKGSTKTVSSCPTFLPRFGGMIFHVSHDNITKDGETAEEREARLVNKRRLPTLPRCRSSLRG